MDKGEQVREAVFDGSCLQMEGGLIEKCSSFQFDA